LQSRTRARNTTLRGVLAAGNMNDALLGTLIVIAVAIVFWCLSVVCEERFVPALAVICDVLKIPDDVAGATLMAAGACSPEVVASFIALFITHSALGVGSVVGSEIFNHLCICAGSVLRGSASETSFSLVAAMA
jgi:Ca2+/Na+ antiporter